MVASAKWKLPFAWMPETSKKELFVTMAYTESHFSDNVRRTEFAFRR